MLPLDVLADLLARHGHTERAESLRSLAAREEMRIGSFWEDLGAAEIWADEDSVAALRLPDPDDDARYRKALLQVAEDMALRGVGTSGSEAWLTRLREKPLG